MSDGFRRTDGDFVHRCEPETAGATATGPRCAVTPGNEIVCSFMLSSDLGANDFRPMLCRSADGVNWSEARPLWPSLPDDVSIFGSVSAGADGELLYFAMRWTIDAPGESFWCAETHAMKQNELVWARSGDGGRNWTDPEVIPMPVPGSAEAPGAMAVTRSGRWLCCYAPKKTLDPGVHVNLNQIVCLFSGDRGRSWEHSAMLGFDDPGSEGAEAWVVELTDGRLLGTSWHFKRAGSRINYPNAFAVSHDGGQTWLPTQSTGIQGQSTGLAAIGGNRALFSYNQREQDPKGVWLAVVEPGDEDFGVLVNECVWNAAQATQAGGGTSHADWMSFAFGEPAVVLLHDGALLVVFWCAQPDGAGIRFVKGVHALVPTSSV